MTEVFKYTLYMSLYTQWQQSSNIHYRCHYTLNDSSLQIYTIRVIRQNILSLLLLLLLLLLLQLLFHLWHFSLSLSN